jgi:hypothetical protein
MRFQPCKLHRAAALLALGVATALPVCPQSGTRHHRQTATFRQAREFRKRRNWPFGEFLFG